MKRFTDRVAVVTGAASGIGRAVAEALAARGCDLAIADIDAEGLAQTAEHIEGLGRRVTTHRVDVSDRAQMEAFAAAVEQAHGRVDVLVNNAGVTCAATFEEQSLEDFEWVVGINFWGVVYGCKLFLPLLLRQDDAYVVNLSSMFGLVGMPRQTSYCATKFAVRGFSESLAVELAGTPVKVLSVHPGGVRTNIARSARYAGPKGEQLRDRTVRFFEKVGMTPAAAAARILAAMERNAERLLITPEAYVTDVIKRIYPAVPSRFIAWVHRKVT
jgi:NAD(P)-dependent dehydrogenase (short-subunit alcohol dehydrogenase family)